MNDNIKKLKTEFQKIQKKGYIESVKNGKGSVGLTLEHELGKKCERSNNPDYLGIEIKAKKSTIYNYISLFNMAPDSEENAIKKIQEKYGYPDKQIKKFKVFNMDIHCNKYNINRNKKYIYKLEIAKKEKKVNFLVYDDNFNIVDNSISWSFKELENRLLKKLSYLAVIDAIRKYELGKEYFKYKEIKIYKLKGFNIFLKLLEIGKIKVTFKIGVYKNTEHYGETYDHGTAFCINRKYINELFEEVD